MKVNEGNIYKLAKSFNSDSEEDITHTIPKHTSRNVQIKSNSRRSLVEQCIRNNLRGCDLTLCLFSSALYSYRTDKCLRPFPSRFIHDGSKDLKQLCEIFESIPPLKELINLSNSSEDIYDFLYWIFIEKGQPVLRKVSVNELPGEIRVGDSMKPNYVYEVTYTSRLEEAWECRKKDKGTIWAFHGSQIDNFYSILKCGLQQNFTSEKVLFGNGIYLTNELTLSANYAPYGQTWSNSLHGNKNSIIAVCEIINDIEHVRCKDDNFKSRSINENSFGEIPDKYFVVTDSDMVRVKYLLVYTTKSVSNFRSFLYNNMLCVFIVLYVLLLLFVGFINNSNWKKYYNNLAKVLDGKKE